MHDRTKIFPKISFMCTCSGIVVWEMLNRRAAASPSLSLWLQKVPWWLMTVIIWTEKMEINEIVLFFLLFPQISSYQILISQRYFVIYFCLQDIFHGCYMKNFSFWKSNVLFYNLYKYLSIYLYFYLHFALV